MTSGALPQWLTTVGMEQYADLFERHRIGMDVLPHLTEQDLKDLEIPLGDRKRLLGAITQLASAAATGPRVRSDEPARTVAPQAERRQLTVMFCDLVGSTELSRRLDPEELRRLIRQYQDACVGAITRFDGHVAQYLGDGVLAYFGYPVALEGGAERAIRAALAVIERVREVSAHLEKPLQVRIGIDTGLVVIGQGDTLNEQERTAIGDAPNIAARLQAAAEPGSVVVSDRTHQLAAGSFDYRPLGAQHLKGVAEPMSAWQVVGECALETRFDATTSALAAPMVGRGMELDVALRAWQSASQGKLQVLLLCGEPGIGKSRIVWALREHLLADGAHAWQYQCSPYFSNSALYPIVAHMERALGFERDESAQARLNKLEAFAMGQLGRPALDVNLLGRLFALPVEERYGALPMSPQKQKDETLRALGDLMQGASREQPLLVLFEDAHWADPTTLEAIDQLLERSDTPALVVITYRPEFKPTWIGQPHVTALTLGRLDADQIQTVITRVAGGKPLPREIIEQIVAKTDGVPLFVEELTKAILESNLVKDSGTHYALAGLLPDLAIPNSLRDSLMARLDRLAAVKEVAQIGACIGREFSDELLALVSPLPRPELEKALDQLAAAELVFKRGSGSRTVYMFKHALVQDTAYDSLLRSKRAELHAKIGATLERRFPETATNEPELLARHYTEAGLSQEAVPLWIRAGEQALARSANLEAISHFRKALDLLERIPTSHANLQHELSAWLGLGPAYIATRGFSASEVEQAAQRSRELCEQLGEEEGAALATVGKFVYHMVRSELRQARVEADTGLALTQKIGHKQLEAHMNLLLAGLYYWEGRYRASQRHIDAAIVPWDPAREKPLAERLGLDTHCIALAYRALSEFAMGHLDRSKAAIAEAIRDAERLDHAQNTGHCLGFAGWLAVFARDAAAAREWADRTIRYCREQRLIFWEASGYLVDGWALIQEGQFHAGVKRMHEGIAIRRAAGAALVHSGFNAILAECHLQAGEYDEAMRQVEEGLAHVAQTGERAREAELLRVRGELLRASPERNDQEAARHLERAIAVARSQEASLFQLRAATGLACLYRDQGKRAEAIELLAPIYGAFTEGFDAKDLMEARALLDELQGAT